MDRKRRGCAKRESTRNQWKQRIIDALIKLGIISRDPKCRFSWLVPWPMGTQRDCCGKHRKNYLPKINPEETKCQYKPLFKLGQIWVWIMRGITIPRYARSDRCEEPCKKAMH